MGASWGAVQYVDLRKRVDGQTLDSLTRKRSEVQILHRPPFENGWPSPESLGPISRFDPNRLHDSIEWNFSTCASVPDELGRRSLEQEQCHPVGRHQDAANGPNGVIMGSWIRPSPAWPGEHFPDLLLGDPRPVTLDHERRRNTSIRYLVGTDPRASGECRVPSAAPPFQDPLRPLTQAVGLPDPK